LDTVGDDEVIARNLAGVTAHFKFFSALIQLVLGRYFKRCSARIMPLEIAAKN